MALVAAFEAGVVALSVVPSRSPPSLSLVCSYEASILRNTACAMLILQLTGTIVLHKGKRDFRTSIRQLLRFLIELLSNSQVGLDSNS